MRPMAGPRSVDPWLPSTLTTQWSSLADPRFKGGNGERYHWKTVAQSPSAWSHARTRRNLNVTDGTKFYQDRQIQEPLAGGVSAENRTFSRIAPDLVRDPAHLNPDRADENPGRDRWSMHWSQYEAPTGTYRMEQVYLPEITAYGARPYDSYADIVGGQTQYYVSDTEPFRNPNYVTRGETQAVDFRDPTGRVIPEYLRSFASDPYSGDQDNTPGLRDLSEELAHKEDIMQRQSRKMHGQEWKYRAANQ